MSWLDLLPRCKASGKFRHPDPSSVRRQAAMLEAKGKPVGPYCLPYKCSACGDWHLGHDARRLNRDLAKARAAALRATASTRRRRRR